MLFIFFVLSAAICEAHEQFLLALDCLGMAHADDPGLKGEDKESTYESVTTRRST